MRFSIKIAEQVIEIDSLTDYPYFRCHDFLTDEEPSFKISITESDIEYERNVFLKKEGHTHYYDTVHEYFAVLRKISEHFVYHNILLMHGAVIAVNNNGYIFLADSGTGKTTHIMKWIENLPEAYIVNGDKPFLMMGEEIRVCGTPWAGKECIYNNRIVPLKGLCILERAESNSIRRVSFSEAFPYIYRQMNRSSNVETLKKELQLLLKLSSVSCYMMQMNNFAEDAFETSYNAMVTD